MCCSDSPTSAPVVAGGVPSRDRNTRPIAASPGSSASVSAGSSDVDFASRWRSRSRRKPSGWFIWKMGGSVAPVYASRRTGIVSDTALRTSAAAV